MTGFDLRYLSYGAITPYKVPQTPAHFGRFTTPKRSALQL
jgi:hypothetical protein